MSTSRRATGAAALLVMVTGVAGCGSSQLFHDSTTAASYQGGSVSVDQVDQAVKGIKAAFGANAATFDAKTAITYLLFADEFQRVAGENGGAVSAAQARGEFAQRKVNNPSTAAVTALRSNIALGNIGRNPQGVAEINKLLQQQSVQVNPRFGTWSKSNGVIATNEPWILSAKKS